MVGRYCVAAPLPLGSGRWWVREWAGKCVVFDGVTGACHLLSEPAGAVFDALLQALGESSTLALSGSTEEAQFTRP